MSDDLTALGGDGGVRNALMFGAAQFNTGFLRLLRHTLSKELHKLGVVVADHHLAVTGHQLVLLTDRAHITLIVCACRILTQHDFTVANVQGVGDNIIARHALFTVCIHSQISFIHKITVTVKRSRA